MPEPDNWLPSSDNWLTESDNCLPESDNCAGNTVVRHVNALFALITPMACVTRHGYYPGKIRSVAHQKLLQLSYC